MSFGTINGGPAAIGDTLAGVKKPVKNVAIVYGSINYLTLGSVITVAKGYVDKVFVLPGDSDERVASIAQASGAEILPAAGDGNPVAACFNAFSDSDGVLVLLHGDGSHDPYQIPLLYEQIKKGYDAAVSSNLNARQINECIYHMNNKKLPSRFSGFLALSYDGTERFIQDFPRLPGQGLGRQLQVYVKGKDLKAIKLEDNILDQLRLFRIGVVVPAFNEERLIGETLKGIPGYVSKIYVIDDASTDRTPEIIRGSADARVVNIRHEQNKGVGAAIITGYKRALEDEMDLVAVMAGDNQMDPEQLPRLLMPILEGTADYTKGNRLMSKELRKGMSSWRSLGNFMLTMITKIGSGYWHIADPQNGYTAISREALESIDLDSVYTYYGYCNDLLIKLNTFSMRTADVIMPARYGQEKSHIKYGRYIRKVAPMIFRGFLWRLKTKYMVMDFNPLVLFYIGSMIMLPAGAILTAWMLIEKLLGHTVQSYVLLSTVFLSLCGLQMLLFAMMLDMQENKKRISNENY